MVIKEFPSTADGQTANAAIPDRGAFADVRRAVDRLRRGDPVRVEAAGESRIVFAVETLDEPGLALARHLAAGPIAIALTALRATALGLEPVPGETVEVALAQDARLTEIRVFADPGVLTAQGVGTGGRSRPVEGSAMAAALALAKIAGLMPAMLYGDADPRASDIPTVAAERAQRFAEESARWLVRVADARVPLADAENARLVAFRPYDGGPEYLAIVIGAPDPAQPTLVRIHSACFTGDLIGSLRCDCGDQLRGAIQAIAAAGAGVVIYLPQEGRGIGLVNKLRAYALQDAGLDTVDANLHLGFAPDERSYGAAGEILRRLGIARVRLLTNNPEKLDALARMGCEIVERVPLAFAPNPHNLAYLTTKRVRSGHSF